MVWPVSRGQEEEGLSFSRPSKRRFSSSFCHSGLYLLKKNFTLFLGKEGVPGRNCKVQPMRFVFIPQPVNMFWGR